MTLRPTIKQIGKSSAVYGFGNMLVKLTAILLIPVYTRFLSTSEVGILALLEMVETLLVVLIPAAINNALWRRLSKQGENGRESIIMTAYLGTVVLNLVFFGLIALNYHKPALFIGLESNSEAMFLLVILNIFLTFGGIFLLGLWQFDEKPKAYVFLSVSQFLSVLILTIYLVIVKDYGLWGVVIARSIVYGVMFLYSGIVILSGNWAKPSIATYGKLIKFGAPLILLFMVTPMLSFSDRFFLNLFVPLHEIGIYSIVYRFGLLINMVLVIPLQRGWGPMMYRLGIEERSHQYYRDIMFYYGVIGALIFLAISFFIEDLLRIIATPEYISGARIVPIVALAYYVNGFKQFFTAGAALKDKTPRLAIAGTVAILVNLILNYFLIRSYGVLGAAWATLISYSILVLLIYSVSQKLTHIHWRWSRLFKLGLVLFASYALTELIQSLFDSWDTLISFSGLIVFVVLLRLTNTIGYREINGLKSLFKLLKVR